MPSPLRPAWKINLESFLGRGLPGHQGPVTKHFDGKRFHNLEPKPHKGLYRLLKWQLSRPP